MDNLTERERSIIARQMLQLVLINPDAWEKDVRMIVSKLHIGAAFNFQYEYYMQRAKAKQN
jgi:hypothetical protein